MIAKDNIYNVIITHRLPVSRNGKPIKEFLSGYFDEYIHALKFALHRTSECKLRVDCYSLIEEKLPIIIELCSNIIRTFDLYDSANMKVLYEHFDQMMKKVESYLYVEEIGPIGHEKFKSLYRIRQGENEYSRLDMFHIPFDKRQLIKSYRYSISGYPCLYLSTGLELCWFECGMPKKFSYSSFAFNFINEEKIRLINFIENPLDLVSSAICWYHNYPDEHDKIDLYLIKYLVTNPIRTACSVQVANRDSAFIQEYIFPQQLLLWIRQHNNYDGVAYTTSSAIENAQEWNYFNIVLPAKKLKDGYCEKLTRLFKVTSPVKVELSKLLKNRNKEINKVDEFVQKLENKYYNGHAIYPYRELLSLCKTFLMLCNVLSSDDYSNGELLYQAMDTLNLFSYLITDNIENIKKKAITKGKEIFYGIDSAIIESEFNNTFNDFSENVKPVLFSLWGYILRIRSDYNIERTTFEFVL
ncbi:hypothetical protein CLOACE_08220 [Clostridium acetireducens DSM 10703]|uniref:Uncharacterized protein n=1 Tax=Clostridium acetireducens DSM 10703 TaxID=1121290 RepID=A0A1E8EZV7_9CLOT|nr:hypothetical protein [Clostridium acetireducens]OFI06667.1 hypothetical protein CLOACE_08220 [Clostridium acetireducens DSM 10703]